MIWNMRLIKSEEKQEHKTGEEELSVDMETGELNLKENRIK